jgi:hypothetical protein
MSSSERLNAAQAKLEELGYVDLKFFLKQGTADRAISDVENNLASLLEHFVEGNYVPSVFNDSDLVAEPQPA